MKNTFILFLVLVGILPAIGQEETYKNIGVIYVLSDSIYQNHVGLTIFENFIKAYPQEDSINLIIEDLLDKEIKKINGINTHKLGYSIEEVDSMIEIGGDNPISSFGMILIIKDMGVLANNAYISTTINGRGIYTGFKKTAQIFANLNVEIINTANGERRSYNLNNNKNGSKWRMNAIFRTKKKYFSPGENKKELSDDKLLDIQANLLEMYGLQIEKLFAGDRFFRIVYELFIKK